MRPAANAYGSRADVARIPGAAGDSDGIAVVGTADRRAGQRPAARPGLVTHKLSSNENPAGAPPAALASVQDSAVHLYPDPGSTHLLATLASYLEVADERVCVGCGSVSLE